MIANNIILGKVFDMLASAVSKMFIRNAHPHPRSTVIGEPLVQIRRALSRLWHLIFDWWRQ